MYHLFKTYGKVPISIFITSFLVFLVLNIIENLIHYNIGLHTDEKSLNDINMPTKRDWIRIIVTMFVFAILQGFFVMKLT
jgi:hypothetical protein